MAASYFNTASSFLTSTASSLVARTAISSNYTLQSAASASTPGSSAPAGVKVVQIGVWKVERATHNSNGKVVSVWTCDKSALSAPNGSGGYPGRRGTREGNGVKGVERALEVLKKEATSLSRLRHPCILEMAEPMEETRSAIIFATEPVTASLRHAISASAASRRSREDEELELDEVEIQKGLSQLGKGLQFLHESAKLVHGNLTPDSVIINAKGDWKVSGFGLSAYLYSPEGVPASFVYPEYDHSIPPSCQYDYDYMAPEYLLDESAPSPSNDMYALGCLLHSIHTKTGPPFSNRHSLQNARTNIEEGLAQGLVRSSWRKLSDEVQSVLSQLITRYPSSRLSAASFLAHNYFSSLLVSTLRFLERDSFAAQTSEAQASFLKGLVGVLPRFSDKVNRRKVLPSLLEETRKAGLVPFLLPNILYIASKMDADTFRAEALPHIKPLFIVKEPPQAVISLIDNLNLFIEKCTPAVFREEVMPLIYGALESENPVVLERALKVVPGLSETLDYTTVKQTLFPKITTVFSKTTMLSVKVNTLICFHSMIKTLDKFTLTEKLVPLLAKIKTKEPSVMIATLAVHEEMGSKVTIEAIATLILPQLWAMSMGPLLNASQFGKFMSAIRKLGARVEEEQSKHLAELKRLEDSSGGGGGGNKNGGVPEVVDFESLVRGGGANGNTFFGSKGAIDVWADDDSSGIPTPARSPAPTPFQTPSTPILSLSTSSNSSNTSHTRAASHKSPLGARSIPPSSFPSSFPVSPPSPHISPPLPPIPQFSAAGTSSSGLGSFAALTPTTSSLASSSSRPPVSGGGGSTSGSYSSGKPNYDISLPSAAPTPTSYKPSTNYMSQPAAYQVPQQPSYQQPVMAMSSQPQPVAPNNLPPGFSGYNTSVLTPKVVAPKKVSTADFGNWADLDPLGK